MNQTELLAAKARILQVIRMKKQESDFQTVTMLREALELIDRQIKKGRLTQRSRQRDHSQYSTGSLAPVKKRRGDFPLRSGVS